LIFRGNSIVQYLDDSVLRGYLLPVSIAVSLFPTSSNNVSPSSRAPTLASLPGYTYHIIALSDDFAYQPEGP
jgi:hypothetical protein